MNRSERGIQQEMIEPSSKETFSGRATSTGSSTLGPIALRNGGVDLGFMKRWDLEYSQPSSPTQKTEEEYATQFALFITYRDGSRDTFTREAAELLLAHLQDHAASSFWHFRPEPPYPTPAERAHQLWMSWQRDGNRPLTDIAFVRTVERGIHEALQSDEQRRIRLMDIPSPEEKHTIHL